MLNTSMLRCDCENVSTQMLASLWGHHWAKYSLRGDCRPPSLTEWLIVQPKPDFCVSSVTEEEEGEEEEEERANRKGRMSFNFPEDLSASDCRFDRTSAANEKHWYV